MTSINTFEHLGWELQDSGTQLLGVCVFCGKHKMYVDRKKTTYQCKVCGASGNSASVMTAMADKVYKKLPKSVMQKLALSRALPPEAFALDTSLRWDPILKKIVFCVRDPKGKVTTIRRAAAKRGGGYIIRNLKETTLGLLGVDKLPKETSVPIYVCEGEWDRIAWMWVLSQVIGATGCVLAVPGASNFTKEWASYLKGRPVFLLYDNDTAGAEGAARAGKYLKPRAKSCRYLHWDAELPDGFDIRDAVRYSEDLGELYRDVHENCLLHAPGQSPTEAGPDPDERAADQESLEPMGIEELHATFNKWLLLQNCDLLDIVMGTLWSVHFDGNPLWMFIVSPPSGSKSETLMPVSEWYRCFSLSTVTSKSLISGFQTAGGGDPSLFAELEGKRAAIVVKDLTPLLQSREAEQEEVFGVLRDAYDGTAKKVFGNGVTRTYSKLHFSLIAGVTPAIDAYDSVAMGERFLKFRADRELDREDDLERAVRAIMNTGSEDAMKEELKSACVRSLVRKLDPAKCPKPCKKFVETVSRLAWLCARMRAVSPSDRFNDVQTMTAVAEAPPRLAIQFTKLARGLAMHYEAKELTDPRILRLVRRVALHTPDIITTKIVRALYDTYESGGVSIRSLSQVCGKGLTKETIRMSIQKLVRTGLCETIAVHEDDRNLTYRMEEKTYSIVDQEALFKDLPKNDPFYRGRRLTLGRKK